MKHTSKSLSQEAGQILGRLRRSRPLVHNITNYVVMNFTANALLSLGASPVMAHAREEVEEMVSMAGALVLNIGTLSREWIDSMHAAGIRAGKMNIPVVLDPVGAGATGLRTRTAREFLDQGFVSLVRGNASEIMALGGTSGTRGVDTAHSVLEAAETARELASELGTVLAITGPTDIVTDGERTFRVGNGHPLMSRVTGTGCAASAVCAALSALEKDGGLAAASALALVGAAGEQAGRSASGPGSFQAAFLDALYTITPEELAAGANIASGHEQSSPG
jgi:hydroxyethylthiazole kinase